MNRKKVGILTFFNRLNYGAELQAYALHKKVKELGYNCEIIDVLSPNHPHAKKPQIFKPFPVSVQEIPIKSRVNLKLQRIINSIAGLLCPKRLRNKIERFERFKEIYMNVSAKKYCNVDELYNQQMPYDILIAGSDQVWNPRAIFSNPEPYFLTFASGNQKRISYAASFGVNDIPEELKYLYKKWLSNIEYISVRENQGADIVQNITGRNAKVVLDPTLLLTPKDWNSVAIEPILNKPYILLYVLVHSPYINKLAYYLSRKTGYSIIKIARGYVRDSLDYKVKNFYDAGPSEFLGLFKKASLILTSSFHGTAFSVNYNKPFYSVIRKGGSVNSRMISLLTNLGLSSHILFEGNEFPCKNDIIADFSQANVILEREREKSLTFLIESLRK